MEHSKQLRIEKAAPSLLAACKKHKREFLERYDESFWRLRYSYVEAAIAEAEEE